ncbi:hypothetical protein DL96DRAFT_1579391 [Flagelloscypha sp. PMI_526]|nr:hypothetical protein DL96DRAFT_1579391 [Flagelloscypha sp. PMI_526]
MSSPLPAVAVYCGSSPGNQPAFAHAAKSLGSTLAKSDRPLVYGGGSKGIMGVVSLAALEAGGKVTGVVPYAMVAAGGEKPQVTGDVAFDTKNQKIELDEAGREGVETIVVDSMHERKVAIAERSGAFVGLPGGFGTFEEVFEAVTWTQLGIHDKPIILVNVLGFWTPFRQMIKSATDAGFISPKYSDLVAFVDGPESPDEHGSYDWGKDVLEKIDEWYQKHSGRGGLYDWSKRRDNSTGSALSAT